jgi:hypothetical protein
MFWRHHGQARQRNDAHQKQRLLNKSAVFKKTYPPACSGGSAGHAAGRSKEFPLVIVTKLKRSTRRNSEPSTRIMAVLI